MFKNVPSLFTEDSIGELFALLLNDSMSAGVGVEETASAGWLVHLGSFEVCKVDGQLWAVFGKGWAVVSVRYVTRRSKER